MGKKYDFCRSCLKSFMHLSRFRRKWSHDWCIRSKTSMEHLPLYHFIILSSSPSFQTLPIKLYNRKPVLLFVRAFARVQYQAHINQQLMSIKNKINFPWLSQITPAEREDVISNRCQRAHMKQWIRVGGGRYSLSADLEDNAERSSPLYHKKLMKLTCSSQ